MSSIQYHMVLVLSFLCPSSSQMFIAPLYSLLLMKAHNVHISNGDFVTNGRTSMSEVWTESKRSSTLRERDASGRGPASLLDGAPMWASGYAQSLWTGNGVQTIVYHPSQWTISERGLLVVGFFSFSLFLSSRSFRYLC